MNNLDERAGTTGEVLAERTGCHVQDAPHIHLGVCVVDGGEVHGALLGGLDEQLPQLIVLACLIGLEPEPPAHPAQHHCQHQTDDCRDTQRRQAGLPPTPSARGRGSGLLDGGLLDGSADGGVIDTRVDNFFVGHTCSSERDSAINPEPTPYRWASLHPAI